MAKQLPVQSVVCTECGVPVEGSPTLDFLGLHKFSCPHCSKSFTYPMSDGRRRGYLIATAVFAVVSVVYFLATHAPPLPGVLPVLIALGLYRDQKVRAKVAGDEQDTAVFETETDHSSEQHDDQLPAHAPSDELNEPFVGPVREPVVDSAREPVYAGVAQTHVSELSVPAAPPAPAAEFHAPTTTPVEDTLGALEPHHDAPRHAKPSQSVRFDDLQDVENAEDLGPTHPQDFDPEPPKGPGQVKYIGEGSWTLVTKQGKRKSFSFRR